MTISGSLFVSDVCIHSAFYWIWTRSNSSTSSSSNFISTSNSQNIGGYSSASCGWITEGYYAPTAGVYAVTFTLVRNATYTSSQQYFYFVTGSTSGGWTNVGGTLNLAQTGNNDTFNFTTHIYLTANTGIAFRLPSAGANTVNYEYLRMSAVLM